MATHDVDMPPQPCGGCTLHERLEYDPETGCFRWKNPTARQAKSWFRGNTSVRDYRRLYIDGEHKMAHVVAWRLMTGAWPTHEVEHKDRQQGNNRWDNLRPATHQQNMFNRSVGKNSLTGVVGVSRFGARFRATLGLNGKRISLGLFDTIEAASAARKAAAEKHYGSYASTSAV